MQSGKIPDSAITASTEYNANYKAMNSRLHFKRAGGRYGAWVAKKSDAFQYLQVDFGDLRKVTRVAIQGRQDLDQWVKRFSLSYGNDSMSFKYYNEDNKKKVSN